MNDSPTSRRARRLGRGFTIVEVLATLTLASIILPVAARGVLLCLATSSHARRQAQAASLAQSKLADLVASGDLYDSEMKGDFGDDLPGYTWTAYVGDWEEDPRLLQVDVSVCWTSRGRDRDATVSTLVYMGNPDE